MLIGEYDCEDGWKFEEYELDGLYMYVAISPEDKKYIKMTSCRNIALSVLIAPIKTHVDTKGVILGLLIKACGVRGAHVTIRLKEKDVNYYQTKLMFAKMVYDNTDAVLM